METDLEKEVDTIYLISKERYSIKNVFHMLTTCFIVLFFISAAYLLPFFVFIIVSRFIELNIYIFCLIYAIFGLIILFVALIGENNS